MKTNRLSVSLAGLLIGAGLLLPQLAHSHCDTMDGPVILAAKAALEKKDVTPVLKWIQKGDEAELKSAFARALAVRQGGPQARELADQFFFETLVRVHRAGEGAPYTGLKPAGTDTGPALQKADQALNSGSVDELVQLVTADTTAGIRQRFAEVQEKKKHAEHSVEAGREFVAAYVDYVHYVEGLHQQATKAAGAHHAEPSAEPAHEHAAHP